jgi:hypothetical protein
VANTSTVTSQCANLNRNSDSHIDLRLSFNFNRTQICLQTAPKSWLRNEKPRVTHATIEIKYGDPGQPAGLFVNELKS